jgi:hypothetical protein
MNAVDDEKIYYFDDYVKHPDLDVDDVLHFNLEEPKDENFFELDNEDLDLINNLSIDKEQMKKIGEQKKHQSKNKANNKPKKVEEKKVEEKKETIKKATKKTDVKNLHLMNKSEITAKFVNMIVKSGFDNGNNTRIASLLYQNLLAHINDTWANPNDMQVNAKKMFKVVYNHLNNNIREMNVGDKLVAAQRMTDLTLNTFSPVAADPKLARYGDNFAIKSMDDEDIQKITNYSGDVESLMKQVKSELGISKENVHFNDDIFNESSVGKIEKIEEHEPIEKSKLIE